MACVLKHWREAATLMVCARRSKAAVNSKIHQLKPHFRGTKNEEKPSGELVKSEILLRPSDFDYDFIYIERSGKSTYLPSVFVYPGGIGEDVDFSPEWIELFEKASRNVNDTIHEGNKHCHGTPPPMITRTRPSEFSNISPDVAFRINAIRETFEESGILIAKTFDDTARAADNFTQYKVNHASVFDVPPEELNKWRRKVSDNPMLFIEFCAKRKILPDVWSLYEWGNWLSPVYQSFKDYQARQRRYDTMFYMCFTEDTQRLVHRGDRVEAVKTELLSPYDAVTRDTNINSRHMPMPQIYENLRIMAYPSFDLLAKVTCERSKFRVQRYLPHPSLYADGFAVLFPGDELYPDNPDPFHGTDIILSDISRSDMMTSHPAANRHLVVGEIFHFPNDFYYNISTHGRHFPPVTQIHVVDDGS